MSHFLATLETHHCHAVDFAGPEEVAYMNNIDEVEATSRDDENFIVPMAAGARKKISHGAAPIRRRSIGSLVSTC